VIHFLAAKLVHQPCIYYDMNYWLIANNNLICDELIYKLRPFKLKFVDVYFYTCTYKRMILYIVKSSRTCSQTYYLYLSLVHLIVEHISELEFDSFAK